LRGEDESKAYSPHLLGSHNDPLGGVGIITLLPVLCRTWDTSIQWVFLTVTLYMIPFVAFQLFSGSIAHLFDARKTLLFGFAV